MKTWLALIAIALVASAASAQVPHTYPGSALQPINIEDLPPVRATTVLPARPLVPVPPQAVLTAANAVVRIETALRAGSGVLMAKCRPADGPDKGKLQGLVLTSARLFPVGTTAAQDPKVRSCCYQGPVWRGATLVSIDFKRDLAWLLVWVDPDVPFAELAREAKTCAYVSGYNTQGQLQTGTATAGYDSGADGAPVFNAQGEVVWLNWYNGRTGTIPDIEQSIRELPKVACQFFVGRGRMMGGGMGCSPCMPGCGPGGGMMMMPGGMMMGGAECGPQGCAVPGMMQGGGGMMQQGGVVTAPIPGNPPNIDQAPPPPVYQPGTQGPPAATQPAAQPAAVADTSHDEIKKTLEKILKELQAIKEQRGADAALLQKIQDAVAAAKSDPATVGKLGERLDAIGASTQNQVQLLNQVLTLLQQPKEVNLTVNTDRYISPSYVDVSILWALQQKYGVDHMVLIEDSTHDRWKRMKPEFEAAKTAYPPLDFFDVQGKGLRFNQLPQLVLYPLSGQPQVLRGTDAVSKKLQELYRAQ